MKLRFPKKKNRHDSSSVYGRTDVELNDAVRAVLLDTKFPSDKDYDNAYRAILEAFRRGMNSGYGGYNGGRLVSIRLRPIRKRAHLNFI